MKKTIWLILAFILASCTPQAAPPAIPTQTVLPTQTAENIPVAITTQTAPPTELPSTPTLDLANVPTATFQAPATCPALDTKARLPLGQVFKDRKAPYHDARETVLKFLNAGGDPKDAVEKLAEKNVFVSLLDLTHDSVPEFILPSGYLTVFGCQEGQYASLLDIPPSEQGMTAVPLVVQDLNQNGLLEILVGQVASHDTAMYQILEWNGTQLASLAPKDFLNNKTNLYIKNHGIYTVGQSNAQKGSLQGNWEVKDVDGDSLKEIIIRAGVYSNFLSASDLEDSLILKWDGKTYAVAKLLKEATATPIPTFTPLPFSETCAIKVPELRFQKPEGFNETSNAIVQFLNAGGRPQQLEGFYRATIKDLNNDTAPEIILIDTRAFEPYIMLLTCQHGKYIEADVFPNDVGSFEISIMAIKDNNKNGYPEVFVKDIGCFFNRCGALYVIEWDGSNFVQKIKEINAWGEAANYTRISEPDQAYLKDLDNDGIAELVWTGEITPEWHGDHWAFFPQRLATHAFKWDGTDYAAQPVTYSAPKYRFQAVQDGDIYSKAGLYDKALRSYRLAITSDGLAWWTEDLKNSLIAPYGLGPCAETACAFPTQDPSERPVLSAYAMFKKMLVHLLMNDQVRAESTYQDLLTAHPVGPPGYKITVMATYFREEYESTGDIAKSCTRSINWIKSQPDVLAYLTGSRSTLQGIDYENNPGEVCPFK